MAPKITIHNQSGKTISLIPFSRCDCENLQSKFDVTIRLARNIPVGKHEKVKLEDYYLRGAGNDSQIYMLFRVGEIPKRVEPKLGEKLFLCTNLAERTEWNLSLDEKDRVIVGPRNAVGQTSAGANAAGPQDESQLRKLKKEVQELQDKVKDLEKKMAELEKRLAK